MQARLQQEQAMREAELKRQQMAQQMLMQQQVLAQQKALKERELSMAPQLAQMKSRAMLNPMDMLKFAQAQKQHEERLALEREKIQNALNIAWVKSQTQMATRGTPGMDIEMLIATLQQSPQYQGMSRDQLRPVAQGILNQEAMRRAEMARGFTGQGGNPGQPMPPGMETMQMQQPQQQAPPPGQSTLRSVLDLLGSNPNPSSPYEMSASMTPLVMRLMLGLLGRAGGAE